MVEPIGEAHTDPKLILNTVNIKTEQPLSATALLLGERQLHTLNVFDWVSVDTRRPIADQSQAEVLVKVHEGKRNSITYGV